MRKSVAAAGSSAFFVLAPGTVCGLVPWLLTGWHTPAAWTAAIPVRLLGGLLLVAGTALLLHGYVRFVLEGRGTPAPPAAPDRLVVGGAYRYVRNPIYVAVVAAILGQALLLLRPVLIFYAVAVWLSTAVFVRIYEEPALHRRFGPAYDDYRRRVPAWLPRRPAEDGATGPCQDDRRGA